MSTNRDDRKAATLVQIPFGVMEAPLSLTAKLLYVALLAFRQATVTSMSTMLGISRSTAFVRLKELVEAGWAEVLDDRRFHPCFQEQARLQKTRLFVDRLKYRRFVGEHLAFCWLDELIDCDDYVDHARPAFLCNPKTGRPMEYDRFYPSYNVAFEHQGLQHFGTTEKFPKKEQWQEQRFRDFAKQGISQSQGVQLVPITWKDLSLQRMLSLIPDHMPLRRTNPQDPYIDSLERESSKYRASIERLTDERR